jgi:hypothetical protein
MRATDLRPSTARAPEPEPCRGFGEIFLILDDKPTGHPTYGPVTCSVCRRVFTVRDVRSHNGKLLDPPQRTVPRHRPKES